MAKSSTSTKQHPAQPRDNGGNVRGRKARTIYQDMFGQSLQCSKCQKIKPTSEFYPDRRTQNRWGNKCKSCEAKAGIKRIEKLTPELRRKRYESNRKYFATSDRGKAIGMVNGSKQRARKFGWENNISADDVVDRITNGVCEKTGIKFRYEKSDKGITPFSPSLDRIDSLCGYTADNIQVVCSMYNIGKGAHSELDFIALCILVSQRNADNKAAHERAQELIK